ncbi:MAG: acylneuraminate cytidylyltransferase family protein [Alphaproteobacteria bacterium]|nr:acylneuraminate cytidylyltransferase family protein [Alphaproteobacteria bacterium]
MIDGRAVLGVIPARGGSKRLPGKNLLPVAGRPMIAWTVAAARDSKYIDRLIVSTDDPRIAETARGLGVEVPFLRPAELSSDTATSEDVLIHALDSVGGDFALAVLLQPTSPLCQTEDIDGAIRACVAAEAPACVSVHVPAKPLAWLMTKNDAGCLRRIFAAGQVPEPAYLPNGAAFVVDIAAFRRDRTFYPGAAVPYVMPADRSIDIDTETDLAVAEALLQRRATR